MSRDANGNYTLPVGNPVVGGTLIDAEWANTTLTDVGDGLTNSIDRDGRGGMRAPFKITDGSALTPAMAFVNEAATGFYRASEGDFRLSIRGLDALRMVEGTKFTLLSNAQLAFTGGVYTFDNTGLQVLSGELFIGSAATGDRVVIETELDAVISDVNTLDGRVTSNDTDIVTNTNNIATNTNDIATNTTGVTAVNNRVDSVETAVNTLDGRVDSNDTDISGLTGDLSALNGEVDTNTNLLATRGTAFDADVQTNALDATAGRLLTVGAFGLGLFDGVTYPQTSLNNAEGVETGFYRVLGSTTNAPSSVTGVVIHQVKSVSLSQFTQRFIGIDGSSFSRGSSGNTPSNPTWSAWQQAASVASLNLKADIADPNFTGQVRIPTGTAALPALRTSGDSNTGLFFPASDTLAFATGASERMRINASGNVGIGTSSPAARLVVSKDDENWEFTNGVTTGSFNGGVLEYVNRNSSLVRPDMNFFVSNSGNYKFYTGGSERMRVATNGNVGIGTTNPINTLHIEAPTPIINLQDTNNTGIAVNSFIRFTDANGDQQAYVGYPTTANADFIINNDLGDLVFRSGGSERMRMDASGTVKIGTKEVGYNQVDVATQNTTNTNFGASNGYYTKTTNSAINLTIASSLPVGGVITLSNTGTGAATIIPTSGDTLNWFGGAGVVTGNRALAQGGMCTIVRRSASLIDITGSGLS